MSALRYANLKRELECIFNSGVQSLYLVEIGTYDGRRAVELAYKWLSLGKNTTFNYFGFDLFEDLTEEKKKQELSKKRLPPSKAEVQKFLLDNVDPKRAVFTLIRGDTTKTLHGALSAEIPKAHLIYLDGGHSLATIASDWVGIQQFVTVGTRVVLDDYYENCTEFGCKPLVDRLCVEDKTFKISKLDPVDVGADGLRIRFVLAEKQHAVLGA